MAAVNREIINDKSPESGDIQGRTKRSHKTPRSEEFPFTEPADAGIATAGSM